MVIAHTSRRLPNRARSAILNPSSWWGIGWLRYARVRNQKSDIIVRFRAPMARVPAAIVIICSGPA